MPLSSYDISDNKCSNPRYSWTLKKQRRVPTGTGAYTRPGTYGRKTRLGVVAQTRRGSMKPVTERKIEETRVDTSAECDHEDDAKRLANRDHHAHSSSHSILHEVTVKAICARHGQPSKFFSKHFHIVYQAEECLNPTIAIKVFKCHFYLFPLIMLFLMLPFLNPKHFQKDRQQQEPYSQM
jgi:hypothetical protein